MKKSSLFISGILTTFILTIMYGAISAYRAYAGSVSQQPVAAVWTADPNATTKLTTITQSISPQQAAKVAAMYLGRSDLYSVESTHLNGTNVYKVTFSSGTLVYVNLDGQVLQVVAAASTVAKPSVQTSASTQPIYGEYEGGDDH